MGWNVKEAAQECGLPAASWRSWEEGAQPRRIFEVLTLISKRTGCDYMWLLVGRRDGVPAMAPYVQTPEQRSTHIPPTTSTPHRPDPRSRPPTGSPTRTHPAGPSTIGVARTALLSRPRRPKAA